jgi:murein DD-endopeptidase MepM/ murein hydrolase activator NlpD
MSWIKKLAITAGLLVIGIVGINWGTIAEDINLPKNSARTLAEPVDFPILNSAYEPLKPLGAMSAAKTENAIPSYEKIPLNLTETFVWSEYHVQEGDTVSGIASKFSVSTESIVAFNNLKEAWNIRIGAVLKIPNMDGIPYTVVKNDNLSKIAAKMKVPQNAILDANNIFSDTIRPGEVLFIPGARMNAAEFNHAIKRDTGRKAVEKMMVFPVSGKITSGYGWREDPVKPKQGEMRFHKALDIAGRTGDSVKAAMQGTVLYCDNNPNLGNFIVLNHGQYQTLYAHLSAYSVKAGEKINQGQEIGRVGDTGYTTGPHLHFEAFHNGNRINPLDLLK